MAGGKWSTNASDLFHIPWSHTRILTSLKIITSVTCHFMNNVCFLSEGNTKQMVHLGAS